MIPGAGGAAAAGSLLIALAILLGGFLLGWWGWRLWHAYRGTPRPPLQLWQWMAAVLLSILPIATALMLVEWALRDHHQERWQLRQDQQRFFTLPQALPWGDMVLPAGSYAARELLEDDVPLKGDASDLRTLTNMRFAQSVALGDLSVNAMGMQGARLLLELAQAHHFAAQGDAAAQDCPAGFTAQFKALKPPVLLSEVPFPVYLTQPLRMAEWAWEACFQSDAAIMLRYWKDGKLIWAQAPDYKALAGTDGAADK